MNDVTNDFFCFCFESSCVALQMNLLYRFKHSFEFIYRIVTYLQMCILRLISSYFLFSFRKLCRKYKSLKNTHQNVLSKPNIIKCDKFAMTCTHSTAPHSTAQHSTAYACQIDNNNLWNMLFCMSISSNEPNCLSINIVNTIENYFWCIICSQNFQLFINYCVVLIGWLGWFKHFYNLISKWYIFEKEKQYSNRMRCVSNVNKNHLTHTFNNNKFSAHNNIAIITKSIFKPFSPTQRNISNLNYRISFSIVFCNRLAYH